MGLITILLKSVILLLDLRHTYDALDSVKVGEIGRHERPVLVRSAEDGRKETVMRRRVGTSKRKAAVKSALTTVLVWNLFHWIEPVCDRTVAWFVPFYDSFKTLFLLWMLFTRSYGASILVYHVFAPMIRPYEPIIDGVISLMLALFGSSASLLEPILNRLASLRQTVITVFSDSAQHFPSKATLSTTSPASTTRTGTATQQRTSTGAKPKKKPPPPPSSSLTSAGVSQNADDPREMPDSRTPPRTETTTGRLKPIKKASQSNLAATRRVLQELPVPRHALESKPIPARTSTASSASHGVPTIPAAAPSKRNNSDQPTTVKKEPSDPSLDSLNAARVTSSTSAALPSSTAHRLGAPPAPPTGLKNYAFIPGTTPQRSVPPSLVSPTPRFPGGFSFSLAATQAAASSNAPLFQAQPRVPTTAQMAPLSLAPQLIPSDHSPAQLGQGISAAETTMTHASVPLAHDVRIVPPPNARATVRKASSSRSLKRRAAADVAAATASTDASSKKRSRSSDGTGEEVDGASQPKPATRSPRKRAKPEAGKGTTNEASSVKRTARVGAKAKAKAKDGAVEAKASTNAAGPTRKPSAAVTQSAPKRAAALETATELAENVLVTSRETVNDKIPRSPRKKASASSGKAGSASARVTAQRSTARDISSTTKVRSESHETKAKPVQRLTRSRTKQNLAG